MNQDYCSKRCLIGIKASEEFLDKQNSAFDAAIDFMLFANKCFDTCPYKEEHDNKREYNNYHNI